MSRWFRFYGEALNDHKVQSLTPDLFKTWINLLCAASQNDGVLPTAERLAFELRVSAHEMQTRLDELVLLGLLDIRTDKKLEPHNWQQRQWKSDDSKDRVRKHRQTKRDSNGDCNGHGNGDVTVTVTPPESDTESDKDPYGLPSCSTAARTREVDDQKFVNKICKDDRTKDRLVRRAEGLGLDVEDIAEACNRHKARNRSAYFTTLCIQRLSEKLPGIDEQAIRSALWDASDEPYHAVMQALLVAP